MERRRVRAVIVLFLAVVALGAAGAAVDTTGSGGGSAGLGEGTSAGGGDGESPGIEVDTSPIEPLFPGEIIPMLLGFGALGGIVYVIVVGVLALLRGDWSRFVEFLKATGGKVAIAVAMAAVLYLLIGLFDFSGGGGSPGLGEQGAEGVSETASETGVQIPAVVGIAIVVVVLVLLLVAARSADDDDDVGSRVAPDPGEGAHAAGGGTPGSTDVGTAPADNEVYRAWLSLADAANADARRQTPAEVADQAVNAGVDEEAAREITSLFESVRYGGQNPTSGVERRASQAHDRVATGGRAR